MEEPLFKRKKKKENVTASHLITASHQIQYTRAKAHAVKDDNLYN